MPGFVVTRGLGGSAASIISRGLISDIRQIFKGGSRFVKKAIAGFKEDLNISAMLISANGKELVKPIFNNISKAFSPDDDIVIKVSPKKLILRKSERIKVSASNIKVRNKYNERN